MYLTYEEYISMGGVLSEAAFRPLSIAADAEIDYYTFGRLKQDGAYSDKVKWCCYQLIDILQTKQSGMDTGNKQLTSASNDGISESYSTNSAADMAMLYDSAVYDCIERYLALEENQSGVNLLYRGVT